MQLLAFFICKIKPGFSHLPRFPSLQSALPLPFGARSDFLPLLLSMCAGSRSSQLGCLPGFPRPLRPPTGCPIGSCPAPARASARVLDVAVSGAGSLAPIPGNCRDYVIAGLLRLRWRPHVTACDVCPGFTLKHWR